MKDLISSTPLAIPLIGLISAGLVVIVFFLLPVLLA